MNKDVALKLIDRYSIIPVDGKTKKPLVAWADFQKEKASAEQVKEWFEKYPDAGIGLLTGKINGICVLDVDPRNGGSNEPLEAFNTPTSRTGGGGWHYIFGYPDYDVPTVPEIVQGVDLKSDGGYIIIPPSLHPSGKPYEWIKSLEDTPLTTLPAGMKKLIEQKSYTKVTDEILNGVGKGERDSTGTIVCGTIIRNLPEGDIDTIGWRLFEEWNKKNDPPMGDHQLAKIFKSIRNRELSSRLDSTRDKNISPYSHQNLSLVFEPKNPVHIKDLALNVVPPIALWDGYLYSGYITLLSALWKVGKSTLIGYLLEALENGDDFAGKKTSKVRALILSEENASTWIKRRDKHGLENVYIDCRPIKSKLSYDNWITYLEYIANFCKENEISLLIIDTLSSFWSVKDENNSSEVTAALLPITIFTEMGLAVLIVHHLRKSIGSEGTRTRGSGALGAFVDIMLEFTRINEDNAADCQRKLRAYSRLEETPPEVILELWGDQYKSVGTAYEAKRASTLNILLSMLDIEKAKTANNLADEWDTELHGPLSVKSVRRYIKLLLEDEKIVEAEPLTIKGQLTATYKKTRDNILGTRKTAIPKNEANNLGHTLPPHKEVGVVPSVPSNNESNDYPGEEMPI